MNSEWRYFNKKLFFICISILTTIIIFNILIDPFSIFNTPKIVHFNKIKSDADRNQRITKIVGLKLEKQPLESIFLGSSRVNSSISETYYKQLTGLNTKNLGMNALSHDETFKIAHNAILIHPEIKTIYIGLDFFRFLEKNKDNKRIVPLSNTKKLTISEINPLVLSLNTTIASINTLKTNLKKKKMKNTDKKAFFLQKIKHYSDNYKNAQLANSEFLKLKNFKNEMEKSGYKIVFYTNPTHITDLVLIHKLGYLKLFNEWKIELVKHFNYTDFNFVNEITTEEINNDTKYFIECSHSSMLMGKLIIDNLINKSNSYGKDLTTSNIKEHIINNNKLITEWESKNNIWENRIQEIANNGF